MNVDWNKPIEYLDAESYLPARVLCTDRKNRMGTKPVLLLVTEEDGTETIESCDLQGKQGGIQAIRNKRIKHDGWINLMLTVDYTHTKKYNTGSGVYKTKKEAILQRSSNIVYVDEPIFVEWED